MRRVLGPVVSRATWGRALHLAVGAWFAVACALVWPGLEDASPATLGGLFLAPLPALAVLACVPAVRRSEGLQARALVVGHADDVTLEPARAWRDRGRVLAWLLARVWLGVLGAELTALAVATTAALLRAPDRWAVVLVPIVLLGWAGVIAVLGRLLAVAARRLLGPSATERLAVAQARAERLQERARLAAELHDSIGHALTVTVLQAGAAREVADRDPAFVASALAAIEETARRASTELDRVLALLRETAPDRAAAPTLAEVGDLARAAEAAGATVDLQVRGPLDDVPAVVSREGYRMVQEALTNALRHAGPVPVSVRIRVEPDVLHLAVGNPVPAAAPAATGAGSGVRGLRERAALLGGTAAAGVVDQRWEVTARLPLTGAA